MVFTVNTEVFFRFFSFLLRTSLLFSRLPFTANKTHTWTNNNSQFSWVLHSLLLVLPVADDVAAVAHSTHQLTCTNYTNYFGLNFVYLLCTRIQSTAVHYNTIHSHSHSHSRTHCYRCVPLRYAMLGVLARSLVRVCVHLMIFFSLLLSLIASLVRSLFRSVRFLCMCVLLWIKHIPKQRYTEKHTLWLKRERKKSQAHKWEWECVHVIQGKPSKHTSERKKIQTITWNARLIVVYVLLIFVLY